MNERMTTTKATMKTLMAVLMLGGALSMQPACVVWAGPFDGAMFSVQDRGFGGAKRGHGGQDRRQFREARTAQPVPQPAPQPPRERPRGQLTEEERRQLHRDLDKANRELYGGNRR
ncbi:MAG TPA: hypothetical protein VK663_02325 [Burkholderiales bacterium]|nr:hypothetical protein [Burkholderiales bacterium]